MAADITWCMGLLQLSWTMGLAERSLGLDLPGGGAGRAVRQISDCQELFFHDAASRFLKCPIGLKDTIWVYLTHMGLKVNMRASAITSAQIRAARALLRWSAVDL